MVMRNVQGVNADGEEVRSMFVEQIEDHSLHFDGPSLTRQEYAEECDLNVLMSRYEKTGVFPQPMGPPQYLDLTGMPPDLMSAMAILNDAQAAFMRLPALVRKEFDNDPAMFVEFAQDPANLEQLRKWGLAEPEKVPDPPMRVEVVSGGIQSDAGPDAAAMAANAAPQAP